MATSASITAKLSDGRWASIYVHYDGYYSHTGAILTATYATQERVDMLMALGNLSMVGPYLGCPDGHTFENPVRHYCIAYHRDRNEELQLSISDDPMMACRNGPGKQQYNYVWNGERWLAGISFNLEDSSVLPIGQLAFEPEPCYTNITQTQQG